MQGLFGEDALPSVITNDVNTHIERIDAFRSYEAHLCDTATANATTALATKFDAEREAFHAQSQAELARIRETYQSELERARGERPKPIKLDVSPFEGKPQENISRWFLECEVAMTAQRITTESLKVAFGMSNLKRHGIAREWAYTVLQRDVNIFPSWQRFKELLYHFHQGKHMAHNHRANFLACKQEKRSVYDYVQELRRLAASISDDDLSESVKITVLMEGLNTGPARTELFRKNPTDFEKALTIALEEDNCHKRSGSRKLLTTTGNAGSGPTPMEVSAVDMSRSNERCFNCNRKGHYSRDCRQPQRGGRRPVVSMAVRGRGRGREQRSQFPSNRQGNAAPRQ